MYRSRRPRDLTSRAEIPGRAGFPYIHSTMDAIILAAGKGTRLRPHTLSVPKPLLPVQGRPILDWIVGALPPWTA